MEKNTKKYIVITIFAILLAFTIFAVFSKVFYEKKLVQFVNEGYPENPHNQILVYYATDCDDCQALKDELITLGKEDYIHLIDITTTDNEEYMKFVNDLRKKYEIFTIPSATYVEDDDIFYTEQIYQVENDKVVFDNNAFERILSHLKYENTDTENNQKN